MNTEDKKKIGIVVLAIAAGLIAVILTGNYIRNESALRARDYEQKKLLPLMKEIEALKQENKKIIAMQQAAPQREDGARRAAEEQAVMVSLAAKTPVGKRAVTVSIDSLSAVGGLVNPGDFVDVLARLAIPRKSLIEPKDSRQKEKEDSVTTVVFQNVQVLAVGPNVARPGSYEEQQKAKSLVVTLALDPQEAGLMSFIKQNGDVQLLLRSPTETQTYALEASNWQTLAEYIRERQGIDINPPKQPTVDAVEEKPTIQIFRGGQEL